MLSAYLDNDFKVDFNIGKQQDEETELETIDPSPVKQFEKNLITKGFLPYSSGECYGRQVTRNSHIFIQRINEFSDIWTGYRVTYGHEENEIRSEKTIIEDRNFNKVILRVESYIRKYLDFVKRVS